MPQDEPQNEPQAAPLPDLPADILPDKTEVIENLINDIAEAIEARIGGRRQMTGEGGPYEQSLRIAYDKRLHEAAVAALQTIIEHPAFRPQT